MIGLGEGGVAWGQCGATEAVCFVVTGRTKANDVDADYDVTDQNCNTVVRNAAVCSKPERRRHNVGAGIMKTYEKP